MGDNGVYGLGVLELRLADVDLNLRLSSEIKIAPSSESSENDRDGAHTLGANGNLLHGDGVRRPWLVKSHGYQLKVDFALAPGLKFEDEAYTQQVAAKLKHLEARSAKLLSCNDTNKLLDLAEPWVRGHIHRNLFKR